MNFINNFIAELPLMLLSLPMILLALSIHEASHGFVAYKLGDPTARNLGRLNLNPLKHIDPIGFICMLFFRIGWAKPVPINVRNFKKPRRDMAISAAAGPISNLLTAILFAGLLRLEMLVIEMVYGDLPLWIIAGGAEATLPFKLLGVLAYVLYIGVVLNISLAIFNMIPIPPFDGSRIAHVFLPPKWYFKIMQYEQYIMIVLLILLWTLPNTWLTNATGWLSDIILWIFGMGNGSDANFSLKCVLHYIMNALAF